jgi:hypothetical protein
MIRIIQLLLYIASFLPYDYLTFVSYRPLDLLTFSRYISLFRVIHLKLADLNRPMR